MDNSYLQTKLGALGRPHSGYARQPYRSPREEGYPPEGRLCGGHREARLHRRQSLGKAAPPPGKGRQDHPQKGVRHPHLQVRPHYGFRRLSPRYGRDSGRPRLHQHLGTEVLEATARQISPATRRRPSGRRRCYRQKKPGTQREAKTRHAPQPTRGLVQESNRTADRPQNWHGTQRRQRQARAPLRC